MSSEVNSTRKFYKKGILNAVLISLIIILAIGYQLVDFVKMEIDLDLIDDLSYWISVIVTLLFMLVFLLSVRALRKNYSIYRSDDIDKYSTQISKSYMWVTENNYSTKVEYYIYLLNFKDKYDCYRKYWLAKIAATRNDKRREKRKANLNKTAEEVWGMKLSWKYRYRPIRYSKLFQGVHSRDIGTGAHDINDYEGSNVTYLLSTRVLWILAFSAFTGAFSMSLLNQDSVIGIVFNIIIKLFQLAMAIWIAIDAADDYVFINLTTALRNKYGILSSFKSSVDSIVVPEEFDPVDKMLKKKEPVALIEHKEDLDNSESNEENL